MDYQALHIAANNVVYFINNQAPQHTSADVLASIKNQMIFIRDNAAECKNPSTELGAGTEFTYAILASRELASHDEVVLQKLIDKVTKILIGE
ncbi:hypothetical protein WG68_14285 [Arsukibacterium ikkense]|uniref:Tsi6 domain-containing protein n=2 Tax=Arsukibacterium ikkense TaxID=336831 RepID=A0A0M2V4Z5_9GAMM|nr:hypothetical protein WG68_14285 [Arsukibacterium ikkense]